jgi:hypothetical protein
MHFDTKNYLKNNRYHTAKHSSNILIKIFYIPIIKWVVKHLYLSASFFDFMNKYKYKF